MTTFFDLLQDFDGLRKALSAIASTLTSKQREDLRSLFLSLDGEPAERYSNNVVKSPSRYSCSKVGALLTNHFRCVGPADQMMWIGYLQRLPDGSERWVMREEIRKALRSLGWFGEGPDPSGDTGSGKSTDQAVQIEQVDFRERLERFTLVSVRPEQADFRNAVFKVCKGRCVISGNGVPEALEAAHREGREWKKGHNTASDGILLRRDLHALYDCGLLRIETTGRVVFDEKVQQHYPEMAGKVVCLPGSNVHTGSAV